MNTGRAGWLALRLFLEVMMTVDRQWNCDWECENQDILKEWYALKISGAQPNLAVRKIFCKGCGREFYTQISTKKYCRYSLCGNKGYQKELKQRRLEQRKEKVCKCCGKSFTPKRNDALFCSNACRQKAYRHSILDKVGA